MKILLITLIALSSSTLAQIGPPKDHFTPAVIDGDLAAVQAFLDKGVSANARSFQGGSPLMYAVTHNRLEIAKLLINNGADINFRYNGKTLLHLAAEKENTSKEVVQLLIDNDADLNPRDIYYNTTPLHNAVSSGNINVVKVLVKNDAEINAISRMWDFGMRPLFPGLTPVDFSLKRIEELNQSGASEELIQLANEIKQFLRQNGGTTYEELFVETRINFKRNPFEFNFYTVKGFHYPIQGSKDLKNWETFEVVEGNDRITVFRDQRVLGLPSYYYRVKVAPNN